MGRAHGEARVVTRSTGAPANWRNLRYPKGAPVANRWPDRTPLERLLAKLEEIDGCLIFTGKLSHGYGRLRVGGVTYLAHRLAYEVFVGPIPDGLTLDHLCRNRACVNPAHLEPVTLAENKRRGMSDPARNARKTHCDKGHEFTAENTYVTSEGYRTCRACRRAFARRRYEAASETILAQQKAARLRRAA